MISLIISMVIISQTEPASLRADEIEVIVRKLHQSIKDCEFIYEGGSDQIGPGQPEEKDIKRSYRKFQGVYRYRSDGASYVDVYNRGLDPSAIKRSRGSVLGELTETVEFFPDKLSRPLPITSLASHNADLINTLESAPGSINLLWFFQNIKNFETHGCRFLGWEDVDGQRCLKVKINFFEGPEPVGKDKYQFVFWIDLKRGGHPLKSEYMIQPPFVTSRVSKIILKQINTNDGQKVWFPCEGVAESFVWYDKNFDEPIVQHRFFVMSNSVTVNSNLKDDQFSVRTSLQDHQTMGLAMCKQFADVQAKPTERPRTDRLSLEKQLDSRLVEANAQAKMIEASTVRENDWNVVQILLNVFGVVTLATAFILWKRRNA